MNTLTPQQKLAHVALQLMRTGLPLAQTYATHQAELRLELVLSEERLSSLEGLAASLETLARLERLVETHKAAWRQWVVETTRQLTTVLEHFPEDERAETSQKLMAVLQWQIEAQHCSVAARAEWIAAAGEVTMARAQKEVEQAVTLDVLCTFSIKGDGLEGLTEAATKSAGGRGRKSRCGARVLANRRVASNPRWGDMLRAAAPDPFSRLTSRYSSSSIVGRPCTPLTRNFPLRSPIK